MSNCHSPGSVAVAERLQLSNSEGMEVQFSQLWWLRNLRGWHWPVGTAFLSVTEWWRTSHHREEACKAGRKTELSSWFLSGTESWDKQLNSLKPFKVLLLTFQHRDWGGGKGLPYHSSSFVIGNSDWPFDGQWLPSCTPFSCQTRFSFLCLCRWNSKCPSLEALTRGSGFSLCSSHKNLSQSSVYHLCKNLEWVSF